MIRKWQLSCCALCQITANNHDSKHVLKARIDNLKHEAKDMWHPENRDSGERAAFIIVAPGEDDLEQNVKELGFTQITTFNRRNGYPAGVLKMYFLNWYK